MNIKKNALKIGIMLMALAPIHADEFANEKVDLGTLPPLPNAPLTPEARQSKIAKYLAKLPKVLAKAPFKTFTVNDEIKDALNRFTRSKRGSLDEKKLNRVLHEYLRSRIDQQAILGFAKDEYKIEFDLKNADSELAKMEKMTGSREKLEERFKTRDGMTYDQVRYEIAVQMTIRKYIDKLMEKVTVPQEKLEVEYNKMRRQFSTPEMIRASHILIKVDKKATQQEHDAAKQKLEQFKARLQKGEKFEDLAKANSACGSAKKGGDLGLFPKGRMVKEFDTAAWKLKVGELSGIVKTVFGYHLIKLTEHRPAGTRPLKEVQPQLEKKLRFGVVRGKINEKLAKFKKDNKVEIFVKQ